MSATREEMLEEIVRAGSVERCLAFFEGMPEKERAKFAPLTTRMLRENDSGPFVQCQRVAVLASASLGQVKRFGLDVISSDHRYDREPEFAALRDRKPAWLQAWAEWILEQWFWEWRFVRMLIREGLCEAPDSDMYVLGMIYGARDIQHGHSALEGLRKDPELLDDMVWRLFEVQGNSNASLSHIGDITGKEKGWSYALRELSKEGALDRQRLLDESLAALNRDFTQHHANWFSRFHEYMEPTIEERAARTGKYLDLLASPVQPTVTMAAKTLRVLHKAKRLDGAAFVARAEPALYAKAKGTVKSILGILSDVAAKEPTLAAQTVRLGAVALEHRAPEIQEAALALIEKHGDPSEDMLRGSIAERLPVTAPPVRKGAESWLGETGAPDAIEMPEELAGLLSRAQALSARPSRRAGVDLALAEFEALLGAVPALSNATLSGAVSLVLKRWLSLVHITRRFLRRTLSPRGLASLPVIVLTLTIAAPIYIFRNKYFRSTTDDEIFEAHWPGRGGISRILWRMSPRPLYARTAIDTAEQINSQRSAYNTPLPGYEVGLDPDTPFNRSGPFMMCLGLSAYDPVEGQLATDLLIQAIEDGRLDGAHLGRSMHQLLGGNIIKPNRWADRLAVAAGESPLHAQVVRNALVLALPAIPAEGMRNVRTLLELLFNLCVEAEEAVTDPDCRAFLEGIGGTGKAAKLAKKLLALEEGDPLPHRRAAAVAALRGRLERAERWMGADGAIIR